MDHHLHTGNGKPRFLNLRDKQMSTRTDAIA